MADNNTFLQDPAQAEALRKLQELGFGRQKEDPTQADALAKLGQLGFGITSFPDEQVTPALGRQMENVRRLGAGLPGLDEGGGLPSYTQPKQQRPTYEGAVQQLTTSARGAGIRETQIPSMTGQGYRPPEIEALRPDSLLYDIAGGVYDSLADGVGFAAYTVGKRLDRLGATSLVNAVLAPLSVQVGNAKSADEIQTAVKGAVEKLGLDVVAADESVGGQIGHTLVENLVTLAAMTYGAGALASVLPAGSLKSFLTTIGPEMVKFIQQNPLMSAATEVGAASVGTMAGNIGREQVGPTGEFIGQFFGGPAGSMAGQRLFKIMSGPVSVLRKLFTPVGADMVLDTVHVSPGGDRTVISPVVLRPQVRYHIQSQLDQLMETVRRPMGDLSSVATTKDLAANVRLGVQNARETAANISRQNWSRSSAGTAWVNTENLQRTAYDIIKRGLDVRMQQGKLYVKRGIPNVAQQIVNETTLAKGAKSKYATKPLKVKNMLDMLDRIDVARQQLLRASPDVQGLGYQNRLEGLNALEREIYTTIETAVRNPNMSNPQRLAVLTALEFDRESRALFREGPLGEVMKAIESRTPQTSPEAAISALLQREGGIEAVQSAGRFNPQLVQEYQGYVTGEFRDNLLTAAEQNDPKNGVNIVNKWFNTHRKLFGSLGQSGADISTAVADMNRALAARTSMERSTLARIAGLGSEKPEDIMAGLRELVDHDDAADLLHELVRMSGSSKLARDGLKNGLLSILWSRAAKPTHAGPGFGFTPTNAVSPAAFETVLQNPKVRNLLQEVFSPKEIKHIFQVTRQAAELERAGGTGIYMTRIFLARIVGAQSGAHLAQMLGAANIQLPAIGSSVFRQIQEKALGGLQADELFVRALYDPAWNKVLKMKAPTNTLEIRQMSKRLRRIVSHTTRLLAIGDAMKTEGDEQ